MKMALSILTLLVLCTGCGGHGGSSDVTDGRSTVDYHVDLPVALRAVDKFNVQTSSFVQGEPISFELSITNKASSAKQVIFPSSLTFDLVLKNTAGDVVWQLTRRHGGLTVEVKLTLEPNEVHIVRFDWDQVRDDSGGAYLPAGTYVMEGYYTMVGGQTSDVATLGVTIN